MKITPTKPPKPGTAIQRRRALARVHREVRKAVVKPIEFWKNAALRDPFGGQFE